MGGRVPTAADFASRPVQGALFETVIVPGRRGSGELFATEERAAVLERKELFGDVDVEKLIAASSWLPTAMDVARKRRFMHFDLEFADIMRERRGFDLVIGNPPWLKPAWVDGDVLSEKEPKYGIRSASAADVEKGKLALLNRRQVYASGISTRMRKLAGFKPSFRRRRVTRSSRAGSRTSTNASWISPSASRRSRGSPP